MNNTVQKGRIKKSANAEIIAIFGSSPDLPRVERSRIDGKDAGYFPNGHAATRAGPATLSCRADSLPAFTFLCSQVLHEIHAGVPVVTHGE